MTVVTIQDATSGRILGVFDNMDNALGTIRETHCTQNGVVFDQIESRVIRGVPTDQWRVKWDGGCELYDVKTFNVLCGTDHL